MTNTPTAFPSTAISAGLNTAISAPAATSYVINSMQISMNVQTGTAGALTAAVFFGITGGPIYTWCPLTGITANQGIQYVGAFTVPPGFAIYISANSGSGLDMVAAGLKVTT